MSLVESYSDDELRLIYDYFEKTSAISQQERAKLIAANGSRQT